MTIVLTSAQEVPIVRGDTHDTLREVTMLRGVLLSSDRDSLTLGAISVRTAGSDQSFASETVVRLPRSVIASVTDQRSLRDTELVVLVIVVAAGLAYLLLHAFRSSFKT